MPGLTSTPVTVPRGWTRAAAVRATTPVFFPLAIIMAYMVEDRREMVYN